MSDTDNDEEKKKKPASNRDASKAKRGKKATSHAKRKTSRSSAKAKGGKKSTEGEEKGGDEMSSDTASADARKGRASSRRFGPAPKAVVSVRHLDLLHERPARGFSLGELSSSGISRSVASHETVMVDMRRRSVVDQNVEALKAWLNYSALKRGGSELV